MQLISKNTLLNSLAEKAFLDIIREHERMIHKICNLYTSDVSEKQDLFQEIILQLWKSFKGFRNEAKISTWMYRIALNTALTHLRRSKTKVSLSFTSFINENIAEENDNFDQERTNLLHNAIAKLTELEKAIVMLYLDDKSYQEMEEVLGIKQGTLRVKMNRIKEKLRQITKTSQYGT
jgi:RNA polymerase sigma-70 factor (ECF subfamily)